MTFSFQCLRADIHGMTSSAVWTGALLSNEWEGEREPDSGGGRPPVHTGASVGLSTGSATDRAGGMRAARIRSHPPRPCILSDWQPSDQNLHPSSSRKNQISGECRLREAGKPRGKSSLIRPNQSLVFTAYGRGGREVGVTNSSSSGSAYGVKG